MKLTCAICGRKTVPFVFVGSEAIGPRCAAKAGFTPAKKTRGGRLRFANAKPAREVGPHTMDLFEELTKDTHENHQHQNQ